MNNDDQDKTRLTPKKLKAGKDVNQHTRILNKENLTSSIVDQKTVIAPKRESNSRNIESSSEISFDSKINNRFILKEALGAGGMGVVYRAIDLRKQETGDNNPYVAIKLLSTDIEDHPNAFVALQREAKKCQILAHPNIITVYDFDRDGDLVYLTMEELRGQPLDALIKSYSQGLPLDKAIPIITSIAEGLSYAHKKGIIHADLKPANIFYTDENEIKIIDFGIAKVVKDIDYQQQDTLNSEDIEGLSPSYASIEMLDHQQIHPSDDIYALGVISYELLTGRHPFNYEPADLAQKNGVKLNKISKIKKHQWLAIKKALSFERDVRFEEATLFRDKFSGKGRLVRTLSFSLVVISVMFTSFVLFFDNTNTDYLYDELIPAQQHVYDDLLKQGGELLSFNDWNNAMAMYEQAYEILPQHTRTKEAVNLVVDKILEAFEQGGVSQSNLLKKRQISELLKYQSLRDNQKLKIYQESL